MTAGAHRAGANAFPPSTRTRLPFRAVNDPGRPGFDSGLQRHHLLPRQLLGLRAFAPLLDSLGHERIGLDCFRRNGLLLPARDEAAIRLGLPLHCGPHRDYNALVIERVGQIEAGWARLRPTDPDAAQGEALMRLGLLQRALRRRLLDPRLRRFRLNRRDPQGKAHDFAELDAMAAMLWPETAV